MPGDGKSFWPETIRYAILAPLANLVVAVISLPAGVLPTLLPGQTFRRSDTLKPGDTAP